MIVIGIAPGLKALTYAVVETYPGKRPVVLDNDVLLGPRIRAPGEGEGGALDLVGQIVNLGRKAYVHRLILEVIFERALSEMPWKRPKVAIGPACNPREAPDHVTAVRVMLTALAEKFEFPVVEFEEEGLSDRLATLCTPTRNRESWYRLATRILGAPPDTDDRKVVLALVTALAGGAPE